MKEGEIINYFFKEIVAIASDIPFDVFMNQKLQKEDSGNSQKLQKVLAFSGLCSRREAEKWIIAGRILVDGQIAKIGMRVSGKEKILVDGKKFSIQRNSPLRIIAYHKPLGEICTRQDPEERKTVFSSLPKISKSRWLLVGRLDFNTSGLLLFTNQGEVANVLAHPSSHLEREYQVRVQGEVKQKHINALLKGVRLEDGVSRLHSIHQSSKGGNFYSITLLSGKNREVRRLFESQGLGVSKLKRIRFGSLKLPASLPVGAIWCLTTQEIFSFFPFLKKKFGRKA